MTPPIIGVGVGLGSDFGGGVVANPYGTDFVMEVDTTIAGASGVGFFAISAGNTGVYNATVDWGDGTTSTITAYNDVDLTHDYTATLGAGIYEVSISGDFPWIRFLSAGDVTKLTGVPNFGDIGLLSGSAMFYGATNLTSINSYLSSVPISGSCGSMLRLLTSFTGPMDLRFLDTSGVNSFATFLYQSMMSSVDTTGWDTSSVTTFQSFAGIASNLTDIVGMDSWDITGITAAATSLATMLSGTATISTATYDAVLISWNAQVEADAGANTALTNTVAGFNTAVPVSAEAIAARANLISTWGWTITDGYVP